MSELKSSVWTLPNAISVLRLLLVPVFAVLIARGHMWWAVGVLMFSGFTDWLDGFAARKLNQMSKLGQALDPAADRLYILVTLIGLAWLEAIPWWLVGVIIARDVLLAVVVALLARKGYAGMQVNFVGKAGTFCLLYAFPLLLLARVEWPLADVAHVAGWAFSWWGIGLYWLACIYYVVQARGLLASPATTPAEPAVP